MQQAPQQVTLNSQGNAANRARRQRHLQHLNTLQPAGADISSGSDDERPHAGSVVAKEAASAVCDQAAGTTSGGQADSSDLFGGRHHQQQQQQAHQLVLPRLKTAAGPGSASLSSEGSGSDTTGVQPATPVIDGEGGAAASFPGA